MSYSRVIAGGGGGGVGVADRALRRDCVGADAGVSAELSLSDHGLTSLFIALPFCVVAGVGHQPARGQVAPINNLK